MKKGKRPLYPLDIGPRVELTDEQHVLVWVATVLVLAPLWYPVYRWANGKDWATR